MIQLTESKSNWTETISPKSHLFDFKLNEVWQYRDLLLLFVKRDFVAQFRQTILGLLWHLIQPVLTTIMFLLLFNKIAKITTGNLPPLLFYLSSITIWNYFSACLSSSSTTFISNAGIFGKVYFPRLVMPLSKILSNLVKFGIQLSLLLVVIAYYSYTNQFFVHLGWNNLLFFFIVIMMAAVGLGVGIIISSLTTKYRDFAILISFGTQLLMYITPVVYPLAYLQDSRYRTMIQWNPLTPLVEGFRYSLFKEGSFSPYFFIYSFLFAFITLFIGIILFNKVEKTFMDTV
ncbi:MAG: ABC transporter permease [Ilyomonas sp.]